MSKINKNADKEFGLSSWAIENKTTIYVMIAIVLALGVSAYFGMPRESFPEVKETKIYISTPYPGNTAEDIERFTKMLRSDDKMKKIWEKIIGYWYNKIINRAAGNKYPT